MITAWTKIHGSIRVNVDVDDEVDAGAGDDEVEDIDTNGRMLEAKAGKHRQCAITAWTKIHGSISVNVDVDGAHDVDSDTDDDRPVRVANARKHCGCLILEANVGTQPVRYNSME